MKLKYRVPILLCIFIVIFGCYNNNKTPYFDVSIGSSTIPYIQVKTSETIQNEPKTRAIIDIFIEQSHVFSSTIGIEYRGSSSFRTTPYGRCKYFFLIKWWVQVY